MRRLRGWGGAGSRSGGHVAIRSENQYQVDGYSKMQVFVASPVTVSNVQTHSTRSYVAEPINEFQPYCAPTRLRATSPAGECYPSCAAATRHGPRVPDPQPTGLHEGPVGHQDPER